MRIYDYHEWDGPQSINRGKLGRTLHKGGGGSSPSTVTQTTTQQLPSYAQPYAEQLMSRGSDLSNKQYTPYTGQRIAGLNANQQAGIGLTQNQALGGFQGQDEGNNLYQQTVRGDFLNPGSNPYLDQTFDTAANRMANAYRSGTAAQTDANFGRQGAFGGSAWNQAQQANQTAFGDSLANLAANTYGQNYAQERGNQLNAMQFAPQMQNMGYTDAKQLLGAGDIQRSYIQDLLNQQYGDWSSAQNQPYANLDVLQKALSGSIGNASTTMQTAPNPYQASPYATMLGGGLATAGLANSLGLLGG
jgi:hypothetical protein